MSGNPILKSTKSFLIYLFFVLILAVGYFFIVYLDSKLNIQLILFDTIVYILLLAGFGLSFWFSAKYLSLEKNKPARIIISHIVEGIILTIIWLMIGYSIMVSFVNDSDAYSVFFYQTIKYRAIIGIVTYALINSFYYIVIYYTGFQERVLKETELKNLVTEAELKSLKFQINPHFIFNSLNSMSALTEIDPKRARQMIIKLADFLRYTLSTNEKQKNTIKEELKNIKLYLEIEKIRFEDKFEYVENVNDECTSLEIPSMLLQPLFENAIKHAVYETLDKVIISLECKKLDAFMKITLNNNFEGESHKKGAGIGLKNIKERLALIYHQDNLMEVKKENGNFTVNIFIPIEQTIN